MLLLVGTARAAPGWRRPRRQDQGVVGFVRQHVQAADQHEPERVRVRLDALGHVPAQSVAANPVVDRAQRDVCVVRQPGSLDDDVSIQEDGETEQDQGRSLLSCQPTQAVHARSISRRGGRDGRPRERSLGVRDAARSR
jgi:hypothetical protein